MKATVQFYTGITARNPRGTWAVRKTFKDNRHLDNFIDYIQRTKGWNLDEVWVDEEKEGE